MRDAGRRYSCCTLMVMFALGCGQTQLEGPSDEALMPARAVEKFVSVGLESSGQCAKCWRTRTVGADGTFSLEDSEGAAQFTLAPDEQQRVQDIVLTDAFAEAMQARSCPPVAGGALMVVVEWSDVGVQIDPSTTSCIGAPHEALQHPYAQLYRLFAEFTLKYLEECPSTEEFLELSAESAANSNAAPVVRLLCYP